MGIKKVKNKKIKYRNIKIDYKYYTSEKINEYKAVILTSKDEFEDIVFLSKSKKALIDKLKKFIGEILENNKVKELIEKGYYIETEFKEIMKDFRENNIGFHITSKESLKNILENGIIPNGTLDNTVFEPNKLLDKYKPEYIPENILKSESIYLHPKLTNYQIFECYYKDSVILAVDLSKYEGWVGSISVSGFFVYIDDDEEYNKNISKDIKEVYSKMYWKNSVSTKEFKTGNMKVKEINKNWGLDEILITGNIKKEDITLIGEFDSNGTFKENKYIYKYLKEKEVYEQLKKIFK